MSLYSAGTIVFAAALSVGAIATYFYGPGQRLEEDPASFWAIARSVGSGKGYISDFGRWPTLPTAERLPVWPTMAAPFSWISHDRSMLRWAAVFYHAAGAVSMLFLVHVVTGSITAATAAGLVAALAPVSLHLMLVGMSEVAFLALAPLGLGLVLRGGTSARWGSLILGTSVLVRANLIIFPVILFGVLLAVPAGRRQLLRADSLRAFAVCCAIFWALPALWMVRNAAVLDSFTLTTQEGETLFGANNEVVANDLSQWGYWIDIDKIPGEIDRRKLALTMSEVETNRYLHNKGMNFIRTNWFSMPRLIVGKLIRAFVPVPWKPNVATAAAFSTRALVILAAIATIRLWWNRVPPLYLAAVSAFVILNAITSAIYYGIFRFSWTTLEIFYIPLIAAAWEASRGTRPEPKAKARAAAA